LLDNASRCTSEARSVVPDELAAGGRLLYQPSHPVPGRMRRAGPMSEHMRPMSGRDLPTDEPQWAKVEEVKVEDLLRVADNCRDLLDPTVMAKAWDEPTTPDVQLAPTSPRRFGLLPNFAVSDTFDDPLPEAEIAVWEDDSPPETPVTI
jgi:hypothetical protein